LERKDRDDLSISDLDFAERNARPTPPQVGEPDYDHKVMKYDLDKAKWEQSNRKCLMVIKYSIVESIKGAITECDTAKEYLERVAA